jgi:riboflavin kinase/FMN adenylyltransferase
MILNLSAYDNPHSCVVTVGSFDGLHRGHRAVLDALYGKASEEGLPSLVLTFVEPPENYLGGRKELILPSLKKLKMLEQTGADFVVVCNFMGMAKMSPGDFFEEILLKRLKAAAVVVGENFRFGAQRAGDVRMLKRMAARHGMDVTVVQMVKAGGEEVSSTSIRELVAEGRMEQAEELLKPPQPRLEAINKKETKK